MSVFGTWLQGQIDVRGWDNREASRQIGVPETSIHNWTHGKNKPSPRSILKIARGLRVPLEVVMAQAEGGNVDDLVPMTDDEAERQRAEVLARLPQFADIIETMAKKSPERQAAYLEMIRRLMIGPESSR